MHLFSYVTSEVPKARSTRNIRSINIQLFLVIIHLSNCSISNTVEAVSNALFYTKWILQWITVLHFRRVMIGCLSCVYYKSVINLLFLWFNVQYIIDLVMYLVQIIWMFVIISDVLREQVYFISTLLTQWTKADSYSRV